LGSWLGEFLLGPLGPELGGFYLIPALLGAIFCLALYSFVARRIRERPKKE
ncbi:GlsB/YeaQ/YmgE family stress response membrane protein, partial [Enterococcus faecium]